VLRNTLAGSKTVVSISRIDPVEDQLLVTRLGVCAVPSIDDTNSCGDSEASHSAGNTPGTRVTKGVTIFLLV